MAIDYGKFEPVRGSCAGESLLRDCIFYGITEDIPDETRACGLQAGQLACESIAKRVNGDTAQGIAFQTIFDPNAAPCLNTLIRTSRSSDAFLASLGKRIAELKNEES